MIDVPRIRSFLAAAECLSFTEAAKRLYITQPTLSKNISLMEADVGFDLFVRTSRNVSLTAAGAYLYQQMRQGVDILDTAVLMARKVNFGEEGTLNIGCLDSARIHPKVREMLAAFMSEHPQIDTNLNVFSFKPLREKLASGDLDIIVTKEFEVDVLLNTEQYAIFQQQPSIVVRQNHPLAATEGLALEDVCKEPFVSISPEESLGAHNLLVSCCEKHGFVPNIRRYASNNQSLFLYLTMENSVTLADLSVPQDGLVCITLSGLLPVWTVAAWKADNSNPALSLFLEKMMQGKSGDSI